MSNLVSIIVPVFNRAELLFESLDSASRQSHPDVEIVVVDDASEPSLELAVHRSMALDHRIRYIRLEQNVGAGGARNRGFEASTGAFVSFLDSDDLLHPEKVRTQMKVLEADAQADLAVCQTEHFVDRPGDLDRVWNTFVAGDPALRFLRHDVVWGTIAPLWRREAFLRFGGFDDAATPVEDYELHTRALLLGARPALHAHALAYYRNHQGDTATSQLRDRRFESLGRAFIGFAELLEGQGRFQDERRMDIIGNLAWAGFECWSIGDLEQAARWLGVAAELAEFEEQRTALAEAAAGAAIGPSTRTAAMERVEGLGFDLLARRAWWLRHRLSDEPLLEIDRPRRYGTRSQTREAL